MRSITLGLAVAAIIGFGIFAYLIVLGASLLRKAAADDDDEDDEPALPLSLGAALDDAPGSMAGLAPGLVGPRDPVIGTDIARADRNARVSAFQQRETEERQARGFQTRGF